jgi:hypothetical protein
MIALLKDRKRDRFIVAEGPSSLEMPGGIGRIVDIDEGLISPAMNVLVLLEKSGGDWEPVTFTADETDHLMRQVAGS